MLEILAYSLAGTAVLLEAVDIYDTRPGAWLAGREKLLRTKTGRRVDFARTGSAEEVEAWKAGNGGTDNMTAEDRRAIEQEINEIMGGDHGCSRG